MKNLKKLLCVLLVLAMVLSMMAGCSEETSDPVVTDPTEAPTTGETGNYSVKVKSAGGMAMEDLTIYIYRDQALTDLVDFSETDATGSASFTLAKDQNYFVAVDGAPKGYKVEDYYSFNGNAAIITLTSSVITDQTLSEVSSLRPGDVMYDFDVLLPSGENFKLSEALKEKDMVMINFWYSTCSWCIKEFPFMEEAYQMYKDDVEIIGLNYLDGSNETVKSFQENAGLSFPMAACPGAWFNVFGTQGAPTSIIVDRYGVICHIEEGALPSLRPFVSIFDYFTGPDYKQKILTSVDDIMSNVKPTYEMPTSEEIAQIVVNGEVDITFRGDENEYSWPFIITEKNGEACIKSSNAGIEASFSILYADVTLKAGEAIGFDYLISSERSNDILYVIVDDQDIYAISGTSDTEEWSSAYPWVAVEDGTYSVALCYIKDDDTNEGDDCAYVKNFRICSQEDIDVDTYLPRQAATSKDGFEYDYVDVFLNPVDGYYHVGSENGPLLLVNMTADYTEFNDSQTLWNIVYDGELKYNGEILYNKMVSYFSYASNSNFTGYCTVNEELATYLKIIADLVGFTDDEDEWLKMCIYYAAYGKDVEPLEDPIKGLAPFSAYEATLGVDVPTNVFYYSTAIIPRGKLAKFVPEKSGVYRITSSSKSAQGVNGWIFDGNRNVLLEYELDERMYNDDKNVSMVFYMEAGEAYYIDIAFWDVYEVGYIYYDIEYIAPTLEHFRLASMGYFTYDTDATGEAMYHLIAGGIDVMLGDDGYFHEIVDIIPSDNDKYILGIMESCDNDIEATKTYLKDLWGDDYDAKAEEYLIEDVFNGKFHDYVLGSILYCDFTGVTSLFSNPVITLPVLDNDGNPVLDDEGNPKVVKGIIDLFGFDFTKNENDCEILGYLAMHDNDIEATKEYLRKYWGADYDANAKEYKLDEIFAGKYHGYMLDENGDQIPGEDLTEQIKAYIAKMYDGPETERVGCVAVDAGLANLLQKLMDKYTFEGVDHSWTKMCYYYDYLGPEA